MESAYKRGRGFGPGIVQLYHRELGGLSPRSFAHRVGASEALVMRLGIYRKLNGHGGCVNTVSFNADGNILASGSDDRMVMLWDWDAGVVKLSFHSGHSSNVFQAKFMPYSDDQTIVTCAADGEHEGQAHKLAIEPGNPHIFYSCGEDGLVQHFDLRTESATKLFVCRSFPDGSDYQPVVHLNAIAIDPRNPNYFSIAGRDEYARVYDIRKCNLGGSTECGHPINSFCPPHLVGNEHVGITGLAFSDQSELLSSYNYERIYLFTKDQGLGPNPVIKSLKSDSIDSSKGSKTVLAESAENADSQPGPQVYKGHSNCETVKGVSFLGPNCEYVASGSDCGRLFIWRKRDGKLLRAMDGDKYVVNCIEPHPYATAIVSSGIENDVKIWTPNASEPAHPVNINELEPSIRRNEFGRFTMQENLTAQMIALHRRRASLRQDDGEEMTSNADWVNLLLQFPAGEDDSSSDESGDSSVSPGDCIVN